MILITITVGELLGGLVQVKFEIHSPALAGVAHWIECHPTNQSAASSIPSQVICLGYRPGPQ